MSTLRYFMWPWQELFQGAAADIAQRLIRPLDPQLEVDAFLLRFRAQEDAAGTENICVSPEDCRFRPEAFAGVPGLVEQVASDDPRSGWRVGGGMGMGLQPDSQRFSQGAGYKSPAPLWELSHP